MSEPLRVCRVCGLEAWTTEDLEPFTKETSCPHGRATICKKCRNEQHRSYRLKNPLKRRYLGMISRCYSETTYFYPYYGKRGITVCEEWRNSQQAFIDWSNSNGFKPELELDRIDNNGMYSPENCRWTTHKVQMLNRVNTITFLDKGTRICSKCKIEKPFSEFYTRQGYGYNGHYYRCKDCTNAYNRKRHREKRLKMLRAQA